MTKKSLEIKIDIAEVPEEEGASYYISRQLDPQKVIHEGERFSYLFRLPIYEERPLEGKEDRLVVINEQELVEELNKLVETAHKLEPSHTCSYGARGNLLG